MKLVGDYTFMLVYLMKRHLLLWISMLCMAVGSLLISWSMLFFPVWKKLFGSIYEPAPFNHNALGLDTGGDHDGP
jgi:hypothetical protein